MKSHTIFASQWSFYLTAHTVFQSLLLLWMFYSVRLSSKLLGQGYVRERFKSSLRKFYGRYGDLFKHYEVSLSRMLHDILGHEDIQWHPQLTRQYTNLWTYYRTWRYYRFTVITTSASYLDLLLSIGRDCQLHTSIYEKRDDFNFHITNFPFLSSNIPSSPGQPIAFLSLNLYDTPGLAPRMNVLFWGPGDFPVSYSNRDTSRNAWNRHSGSFMVDMGILFSNMKYPSHEC